MLRHRVATIDLDCRQQSFTRYINNRHVWARRTGLDLQVPVHRCISLGETTQISDNESCELQQFTEAVSAVERTFDFLVIETVHTGGSATFDLHDVGAIAGGLATQHPRRRSAALLHDLPDDGCEILMRAGSSVTFHSWLEFAAANGETTRKRQSTIYPRWRTGPPWLAPRMSVPRRRHHAGDNATVTAATNSCIGCRIRSGSSDKVSDRGLWRVRLGRHVIRRI